jgi:acylphosphatase
MMKKITLLALFAMLFSFTSQAQNGNNLLNPFNPGFEDADGTNPFAVWNTQIDSSGTARGKIGATTVNPKEGTRCVRVETVAINPGTQWHVQIVQFNQFFPLKQMKTAVDTQFYTLRFWARADVAGRKFNAVMQKGAPSYATPFETTVNLTTSWVQYSYKFKVPDGDYHPVFHLGLETGIFFLDYVELAPTELIDAPAVADKNLMKNFNPSYELFTTPTDATNWFTQVDSATAGSGTKGAITYITTGAQDGTRALKADVTAVTTDKPWYVQAQNTPFQDLKKLKMGATTDQSYTVRFWAKADAAGKNVKALVQNASYGTSALPAEQIMTLTTAWAQYTYTFTLSADDKLRPVVHMGLEKGIFYLDNFEYGKTEDIVTTPVVVDKNFMKPNNPAFEADGTNWFLQVDSSGTNTARGNIAISTVAPQEGLKCLVATVTAVTAMQPWNVQSQHNPFYAFKKFKADGVTPQSYTLRYWAKADAAGKKINSLVQNAAYGTVAVPNEQPMTLTTAWAQYTYTFTVSADDMLRPVVHMGLEKGTFYLDNFELGKTEDIIPPAVDKNVMTPNNPAFEQDGTNWFLQVDSSGTNTARGNIAISTVAPQQGLKCLVATVTAVTASQPWNVQAQHNPFYAFKKFKADGVTPQSYTLRYWAKADAAGKKINSLVQNAAYGTVAVPNEKPMTLTAAWAQYTYTFTVTADDQLRPVVHMGLEKGTFYLDNFELGKTEDIVSVKQIHVDNDLSVVPNPTTGFFEIKSTQVFENVSVFDISGRLMQKFTGNGANQYDVSNLPKGIYEVVAKSKDTLSVSKLVKM